MVSTVDSSLTNGRQIFASLKRPEINEVINKWIDEIVLGLATLIHIFNPSCIVLGEVSWFSLTFWNESTLVFHKW